MTDTINRQSVERAAKALIGNYIPEKASGSEQVIQIICNNETDFLSRTSQLQNWIDENPEFRELFDVLFDLQLVHFLAAEMHKEDYFESKEWETIEDKTIDFGSEMLNLYLYLSEANENEVEAGLDDFLNEFLLVGEDEFQAEYAIYESLIENSNLLDANLTSLRELQLSVKPETGLAEYFIPIVLFFQYLDDPESVPFGNLQPFELSTLKSLIAFYE